VDFVVWWLLLNLWWIVAGGILLGFVFLAVALIRNRGRRRATDAALGDPRSRG
jgi:hypothetical protein